MSQVLPTVKCSDCGRDVLIRRLGDHLCSSQPPVPSLPIIPAMKGIAYIFNFNSFFLTAVLHRQVHEKPYLATTEPQHQQ